MEENKICTEMRQKDFRGEFILQLDHVQEGERIGDPDAFMAAPLHASVTGEVIEIKEAENQGRTVTACVIRRLEDQKRETMSYEKKGVSLSEIDSEKILEGIREGGLTGMGGAGFPAFRKYETDKEIDTLLVNGAECEPFLTCDYRLMLEQGPALLNGVRLLLKASGAGRAYVCIEDNKPEAIENLRKILEKMREQGILDQGEELEVKALPTKYPQGGERQLIQSVLGREVPMGGLPADAGVIVSNVGTAKAPKSWWNYAEESPQKRIGSSGEAL